MADQPPSRFTSQNHNTAQRLSTNTVGLVALSDFRKRRAEVVEQQEREAREASSAAPSGTSTPPDRSLTGTPDNNAGNSDDAKAGGPVKKKAKKGKAGPKKLLSFGDDEEEEHDVKPKKAKSKTKTDDDSNEASDEDATETKSKLKANTAVGIVPKSLTKAALLKDATAREALRREFLSLQEAVKATEIAIPFVFYDGANTPGGTVRVKKGDFVWVFLDKSRKVGAELGSGDKAAARKAWARVGVDDLMLVRGSVIIPHHYDFYFFALNKSLGPGGQRIFDYSNERPPAKTPPAEDSDPLSTAASRAEASRAIPETATLEGANDDPNLTMVVDRRWYERNKHIYPASTWQDFDPEKDYAKEVRRDAGGNAYFFSR
ncbi:XAP5, circadian clock regulator domain-containing protein [Sarocladium implicatum]|nr:XAP5, circadian clock regulator domain-containing protein [Sarocladium implicatum]